jgi:glycosyltransferase involved in cell wall biosynthesis
MIVKNESRIILRLLDSVKDLIDCFCICDTGSTDNTISLIEKFSKDNNIPGKIIEEPFQNFEYNRSFALKACDEMDADFILLLDADMIFWKNPKITGSKFKELLTPSHGAFYIFQGSNAMHYKNTRIVKNKSGFSYKGVTHEYVNVPQQFSQGVLVKDIVFIKDIGDGGAKSDKFSRDVRLLKNGLAQEPNNERYMFYLANSLKDLAGTQKHQTESEINQIQHLMKEWKGQYSNHPEMEALVTSIAESQSQFKVKVTELEKELKNEAIDFYRKRIKAGGFWEEVWYSYYNIGRLYMEMGELEKAVYTLQQAYILYPQRVENLYEIVKYYRERSQNEMAVHFYSLGRESLIRYPSRDYLFIQRDVYDYKLDYEMTILGFYANPNRVDMPKLCMEVLTHDGIDEGSAKNVLCNYKFYSDHLDKYETKTAQPLHTIMKTIGNTSLEIPSDKYPHFVSSTPSFCRLSDDSIFALIRYVDYKVNDQGGYTQQETIKTKNVVGIISKNTHGVWQSERESFLEYDSIHDNLYVGLEDMRLFFHKETIYYTANRGLGYGNMVIEHGQINRDTFKTENAKFLKIEGQCQVEKNWVMFANDDTVRMVYNWYPMVLGVVKDDVLEKTHTIQTPYIFKYFRGSTNGIVVGNEIWFMCHVVSYEDRRYYYHVMVMLDKKNLLLKNYTKMFTFKKEKVEYCLGMDVFDEKVMLGYSTMDRETHYMSINKSWFESNKIM